MSLGVVKIDCRAIAPKAPSSPERKLSRLPSRGTVSRKSTPGKISDRSQCRYLNNADLKAILFVCGSGLTSLGLRTSMGALTSEAFQLTPKLAQLEIEDSQVAKLVVSVRGRMQVVVPMKDLVETLAGIQLADLLALASDATDAYLIADKLGKVIAANCAWTTMFGFSSSQIARKDIVELVAGPVSTKEDLAAIRNALKSQLQPEECTTFLYGNDGRPFLCQVIVLPNLVFYQGDSLLPSDCFEALFVAQQALEQEEDVLHGKRGQSGRKASSYHLLRFGQVSEPLIPAK